jgi:hypothetical protein
MGLIPGRNNQCGTHETQDTGRLCSAIEIAGALLVTTSTTSTAEPAEATLPISLTTLGNEQSARADKL